MPVKKSVVRNIAREEIRKSPLHWGREITDADVAELVESVGRVGLIHPITVRKHKNKKGYEYLAGERRFRALSKAGINTVPCTVVDCDDNTAALLSIEENIKTKRPTSSEWAEGVRKAADLIRKQLADEREQKALKPIRLPKRGHPKTLEREVIDRVAEKLNVDQRTVAKTLDQDKLVKPARRALDQGKITQKQADILSRMNRDEQFNNLPKMIKESERETSDRMAVEKVRSQTDESPSRIRMSGKVFDRILTRCKELHELADEFRKELTDDVVRAIVHMDRDYLIHCHRSLGQLLDDIDSVEGWQKKIDGD